MVLFDPFLKSLTPLCTERANRSNTGADGAAESHCAPDARSRALHWCNASVDGTL